MLDTWQAGRKQRIRINHVMAAEAAKRELETLTPAARSVRELVEGLTDLLADDRAWELNRKITYHETQANLRGKSIVEFGDEEEGI